MKDNPEMKESLIDLIALRLSLLPVKEIIECKIAIDERTAHLLKDPAIRQTILDGEYEIFSRNKPTR